MLSIANRSKNSSSLIAGFVAKLSVRDALAFSADYQAEKGTGVMALLLWAGTKWVVVEGMSDDQGPVSEGLMTL